MVYGIYNELVTGAYKPIFNWGASHCMFFLILMVIVHELLGLKNMEKNDETW